MTKHIGHNGQIPISSYFQVNNSDKNKQVAYFRGRELIGRAIDVPQSYVGVVVRRDANRFVSADVFKEITIWEHDVPPDSAHNKLNDLLDFGKIADVLHADNDDA